MSPPVVLTVAGTDSGGAAGVAADLATFAAHGVHGACVVTAVTAQDTLGVHHVHPVPVATVDAQLAAVFGDLPVAAVKTGMLGSPATVTCLREHIDALAEPPPVVVDPVLRATTGAVLGDDAVRDAYVEHLLPVATVVTPNLDEARALALAAGLDHDAAPPDLAAGLTGLGPAVVLTGGGEGADGTCTDWVAVRGQPPRPFAHPVVATRNDHGTGCTFSAALAACLASLHADLPDRLWQVAARAAAYTSRQLRLGSTWDLGRGRGPVAHTVPHRPTEETP